MTFLRYWVVSFIISLYLFVPPVYSEENIEVDNILAALNSCTMSVNNVVTQRDRILLEEEFNNIINNFNFTAVRFEGPLLDTYSNLLDTAKKLSLNEEEKEIVSSIYNNNCKKSIYSALGSIRAYGGNIYSVLLSGAISASSAYFNYKEQVIDYQNEIKKSLWEIDKDSNGYLLEMQKTLFASSWEIIDKYGVKEKELIINQIDMDSLNKIINDEDITRKYRRLTYSPFASRFNNFSMYWFYLAKTCEALAKRANYKNNQSEYTSFKALAIDAYDKYLQTRRPIFKRDSFYASCLLSMLNLRELDDVIKKEYLSEIEKNINISEWATMLAIAIEYKNIGMNDKSMSIIQENIDNGYEIEFNNYIKKCFENNIDIDEDRLASFMEPVYPQETSLYEKMFSAAQKYKSISLSTAEDVATDKVEKLKENFKYSGNLIVLIEAGDNIFKRSSMVFTEYGIYYDNGPFSKVKHIPWHTMTQDEIYALGNKIYFKKHEVNIEISESDNSIENITKIIKEMVKIREENS